jgi:hypothetical protein
MTARSTRFAFICASRFSLVLAMGAINPVVTSAWAEELSTTAPTDTESSASDNTTVLAPLPKAPTTPNFEPTAIDRMQANLAQQNHTLDALLEVVKKLEDLSKYDDAAKTLLASKAESVTALQEALNAMETEAEAPTAVLPKPVERAGNATKSALKSTSSAENKQQTPADASAFHAGQILYAQPGDAQRGTSAKVVIETNRQRLSLSQGHAIEIGPDRWLLLAVTPQADNGQMHVTINVNGQAKQVSYPAL